MPAGSEPASPALPRTWRPLGPRLAAIFFAVVLVVAFGAMWMTFPQETKEAVSPLQRGTVAFFVLVGVVLLYALARSKVTATDAGLVVVNGYRRRELEWAEVIAVRMPPGAPWPTADLADGTTISMFGIQASDGTRAREAVTQLKVLLDQP